MLPRCIILGPRTKIETLPVGGSNNTYNIQYRIYITCLFLLRYLGFSHRSYEKLHPVLIQVEVVFKSGHSWKLRGCA